MDDGFYLRMKDKEHLENTLSHTVDSLIEALTHLGNLINADVHIQQGACIYCEMPQSGDRETHEPDCVFALAQRAWQSHQAPDLDDPNG